MRKTALFFFLGLAVGLSLPMVFSAGWNALIPRGYAHVSNDWIKAISYELQRYSASGLKWDKLGENMWYFQKEDFGARLFLLSNNRFVVVFAPDPNGKFAYILTSKGRLFYTPDDAGSVGLAWPYVREFHRLVAENPEEYFDRFFDKKGWPEIGCAGSDGEVRQGSQPVRPGGGESEQEPKGKEEEGEKDGGK